MRQFKQHSETPIPTTITMQKYLIAFSAIFSISSAKYLQPVPMQQLQPQPQVYVPQPVYTPVEPVYVPVETQPQPVISAPWWQGQRFNDRPKRMIFFCWVLGECSYGSIKRTALIDTYQKNIEAGVGKVENIWAKGINKLKGRKP